MRSAATSVDVARLAQVSQSAVSRAFTPGASVSQATRSKVQAAAQRLGYRPNAHARSLTTGRSRIIGLVLSYIENLFYPTVLERLAKRLQQDGHHLLIFLSDSQNSDELVGEILQYKVDGIVLGATTLSSALAKRCAEASIPEVLFNRVMASSSAGAVSSVRSDNVGGGREIARYLLAAGHKRIAYVAGREDSSTNLERESGFMQGLAESGRRLFARAVGNYDFEQSCQAARELFAGAGAKPDAVFVAGDQMAIAVMDTLRHELGMSVPRDVSVVGFDNVPQAAWQSYQLTTFEQPVEPMVEATVELLQSYLRAERTPPSRNLVVPGRLIARASARSPAASAKSAKSASQGALAARV